MSRKNNYFTGITLCLFATLSWGIMFPIMTLALKTVDPFTFTAFRYTIAGAIFLIVQYIKEGRASFCLDGNLLLLWVLGSAGFAGFGFFVFLGQKLAGPEGALSASMMMATMPLLGLLVNWTLKSVRPPSFSFGFILMSFIGVLLVVTKGHISLIFSNPGNYIANVLMIAGALCWVTYTIGASYFPQWSPIKYTALSTLFGLPTIYGVTAILGYSGQITFPSSTAMIAIVPELLYMSLIAGFIGVLCWNQGNKIITPLNGVLFMDVVPVTAFIISMFGGVVPVSGQVIGIGLTVSALILNNFYQRRRLLSTNNAILTLAKRA